MNKPNVLAKVGTKENSIEFLHEIDVPLQKGKQIALQKASHALAKVRRHNEPNYRDIRQIWPEMDVCKSAVILRYWTLHSGYTHLQSGNCL